MRNGTYNFLLQSSDVVVRLCQSDAEGRDIAGQLRALGRTAIDQFQQFVLQILVGLLDALVRLLKPVVLVLPRDQAVLELDVSAPLLAAHRLHRHQLRVVLRQRLLQLAYLGAYTLITYLSK